MKKIPLTQGQFALVDDEDFEYLNQWKWFVQKGYACRKSNRKMLLMHREIMKTPPDMQTDHINGLRSDNRKVNLRICTRNQNIRNQKVRSDSTSLLKGVVFRKDSKKWRVRISINNKRHCLGSFDCKIEAAQAYNEAALKYHGEFAKLNKIP